ncbi:MAG: helix-turn-helix domain-containing protein [Steroidobacteraceae bacterium]
MSHADELLEYLRRKGCAIKRERIAADFKWSEQELDVIVDLLLKQRLITAPRPGKYFALAEPATRIPDTKNTLPGAESDRCSVLTYREAAAIAKCHPDTLRKLMKVGEAPGTKIGRRWIVPRGLLLQWIDERCRRLSAYSGDILDESALAARLRAARERRAWERRAAPKRKPELYIIPSNPDADDE